MPHLHRFFAEPEAISGSSVVLSDQEAHHALHVVRARPGDEVAVFDGQGHEWMGTVRDSNRREVFIDLADQRDVPRSPYRLTLLQAWLHREKALEELIRHGSEIGISKFLFFPAHRSERTPKVNDKWRRTAIEACKQCGRLWLPEFVAADSLTAALASSTGTLLLATRDVAPLPLKAALSNSDVSLLIGPEGDFTEQELEAALSHGAKPVSLGEVTYRAEVAAIVGATIVLYELDNMGVPAR